VSEDTARPLGEWLRQRREELEIGLEQAEADTRIRLRYLEALEAEDFEALPDPVVGRGFLRNYCAYLDLDAQEASERFSVLVAPPEPEPTPDEESSPFTVGPFRPLPLHDMPGWRPRRRWLAGLIVVVVIALLSLLAVWAYPRASDWLALLRRTGNRSTATLRPTKAALPTVTNTTIPAASKVPATAATTPTEAPPTLELSATPSFAPSPQPSPSNPVYTGIFLELVFTDTSWVQMTVDGVREFQGELETGTYRAWYGEERVELRIGNAGAVEVTLNGQKLGTLGEVGDVIDRVFEKVGGRVSEATPTRVVTDTLTTEPAATPTLQPTVLPATPEVTPTLTLTPTSTLTPAP
jgi:cytoskeletal protein RodZ